MATDFPSKKYFEAHPCLGSWEWDIATDTVIWDEVLYRIFGLPEWESPPNWETQSQLYTPESFRILRLAVAECIKSGKPYALELNGRHSSGGVIYLEVYGTGKRDENGKITKLFGQVVDRTIQEKTKADLKESNAYLEMAFENSRLGLVVGTLDGKFIKLNVSFAKMLGYAKEILLQKTFQQITHSDDFDKTLSFFRKVHLGEASRTTFHQRYLHISGKEIPAIITIDVIADERGKPHHLVAEIQDMTESNHLMDSMRIFGLSLKEITQGVLISDAARKIIWSNKAFSSITGYPEEEVVGRDCKFLQGPQSDPETVKRIGFAVHHGRDFHGEILNYRRDGSTFWNELSISPVRDEHGKLVNFIGITRDVSLVVKAREREEEKRHILMAILSSSSTGCLVVNKKGLILYQNQQFLNICNIPAEIAENLDWSEYLKFISEKVKNKEHFLSVVSFVANNTQEKSCDAVELKSGCLLEFSSTLVLGKDGSYSDRLWRVRSMSGEK